MTKSMKFTLVLALIFAGTVSASAEIVIDGRLTHELEVDPGSIHTGTIVLRNSGVEAQEVRLYQTDYRSTADGQNHYEDPGVLTRSNADWIVITPKRFVIPAGALYTVTYTINVPSDATLEGTYWSILMIEGIPKESVESRDFNPEETSVGVTTVFRYAFRVITHFGASGSGDPAIVGIAFHRDGEQQALLVSLENDGTRLVRIQIWAELYDEDGNFIGRYEGEYLSLYPGSSLPFRIDLTGVKPDDYTMLVVIDSGDNNVFGASFPLSFQ